MVCQHVAYRNQTSSQSVLRSGRAFASPMYSTSSLASCSACEGLTLVEILIAAAVAAALFGVITAAILTQMRAAKRIENGLRYREMVGRISYLLAVEGSETADLDYPPYLTGSDVPSVCTSKYPVASVSRNLFRFEIPRPYGVYGDPANVTQVFYYNSSDGDLIRCGVDSLENGVLDHGYNQATGTYTPNPKARIVSRGTVASVSACDSGYPDAVKDRQVSFRLSFTGSNYASDCYTVRAKTIFTCNPPLSTASSGVSFTASISGDQMTVTSVAAGKKLVDGLIITGAGVQSGTLISDSGGNTTTGVYSIVPSYATSLSSRSLTASSQVGDCR